MAHRQPGLPGGQDPDHLQRRPRPDHIRCRRHRATAAGRGAVLRARVRQRTGGERGRPSRPAGIDRAVLARRTYADTVSCPACGAAVPEGARFCPACGQNVARRGDERRVVTVLFADIVGFTTMSETRDPEEIKNLVDRCFQRLGSHVTEFGGRVDKIVGDAIVALFGAPVAHEDDAERAVRAALAMQRAIADMDDVIDLRVGINTGEVLVGALRAGGDYTAMGDVVNVASRLQTVAAPGQVIVGADTYGATSDVMRYEALGPLQARGREEPVEAWRAVEALAPPGYRPLRARSPLIGRDAEIGLLHHALRTSATRRRAGLVLLLGEAGVGKSRLAEELAERATNEHGAVLLEARCVPYGEANVWWPLAEAVRQACGVASNEHIDVVTDRCRAVTLAVTGLDPDSPDAIRTHDALAYVLGDPGALAEVEPARARDEARRALQTLFEGLAAEHPLVLVLSELHWAAEAVLDVISRMLEGLRNVPFLLVATARPELEDRWRPAGGRHNSVVLTVDPLAEADARELVRTLVCETTPDIENALIERSGGNPFFLEELAALIVEGGPEIAELPATLRGIVAARLDALSRAERAVLEDAAVVGRRGTLQELAALAEARGEHDWATLVDALVGQEMLYVESGELNFRSDLVREVAYDTLTKADRARRHSTLAAALATAGDDDLEHLAYHYSAAAFLMIGIGPVDGVPEDIDHLAVDALCRAADHALSRDMRRPAIHFLDDALALGSADGSDTRRIRLSRAEARAALHDLDGANEDLDVARADAEAAGDRAAVARSMTIFGEIQQKRGDCEAAVAILKQAAALWRELGDGQGEAAALRGQGRALLHSGDAESADGPIQEALEITRRIGDRRGEAWALQNLAWIAFDQGDTELADERLHKSMAAFADVNDWGGFAWAAGLLGWVRFFQGRLDEADVISQKIVDEMRDSGDHWGLGMMTLLLGFVRLWKGNTEEALRRTEQALRLFREINDTSGEARSLVSMIRAQLALGRVDDAKATYHEIKALAPRLSSSFGITVAAAAAGLAVQLGDPSMAPPITQAIPPTEAARAVHSETLAQFAMVALQTGDAAEAVRLAEQADRMVADGRRRPFAVSTLAFAYAAAGRAEEAVDVVELMREIDATYLDRAVALLAGGFAAAQLGRSADAVQLLDEAVAVVDGTSDELSKAILRLGRARGLEVLGSSDTMAALADARERLHSIGLAATGWDIAFRLAATGGKNSELAAPAR